MGRLPRGGGRNSQPKNLQPESPSAWASPLISQRLVAGLSMYSELSRAKAPPVSPGLFGVTPISLGLDGFTKYFTLDNP